MSTLKLPAASGGGSISIKGPASAGSDVDLLDTSGNLAISGTSTLTGNVTASGTLTISGAGQKDLIIGSTDAGGAAIALDGDSNGDAAGNDYALIRHTTAGALEITSKNPAGATQTIFKQGSNEKIRITTTGFLQALGSATSYEYTDTAPHVLQSSYGNNAALVIHHSESTAYGISCQLNTADSQQYAFTAWSSSAGAHKCTIRTDGDIENTNGSYGGYSDIKLKENIVDAKSQWADIKALKFRNFNWKADSGKKKLLGLIAQEAETVSPSLVKNQRDLDAVGKDLGTETKILKYSVLYMKAIKALQEAMAKIETLETKVAALEAG